jgi:hypothetical protein
MVATYQQTICRFVISIEETNRKHFLLRGKQMNMLTDSQKAGSEKSLFGPEPACGIPRNPIQRAPKD